MAEARTSEDFLQGMSLMMEVGTPLDENTVPGLLDVIEKIEEPSKEVNEIKGVLETVRDSDYSERLSTFSKVKINAVLNNEKAPAAIPPGMRMYC